MKTDLELLFELMYNKIAIALIRFGDGEEKILKNEACARQGFGYNPGNIKDQKFRNELEKSLYFDGGNNYWVGTNNLHLSAWDTTVSPAIFINQNYLTFLDYAKQLFSKRTIYLVCNIKSDDRKLPFKVENTYFIENNAWRYDEIHEDILKDLEKEEEQVIVLVAGGPYSCTLIHRIWQKNRNNILLDVGSVFDPYLFSKNTRKYHERLE